LRLIFRALIDEMFFKYCGFIYLFYLWFFDYRASVLVTSVETLQGYINAYDNLSSFPEIFLPILRLLLEIAEQKNMPNALRDKIKDVAELIKLKVDEHHTLRRPLQMRKQKPVPIKLLNPKFEEK